MKAKAEESHRIREESDVCNHNSTNTAPDRFVGKEGSLHAPP
jgi:hypothetical protein